ncbi:MAG: hypothetical protein LBV03_09520, partial [Fusobacteriales bacterium]|nr:hypothetical protein [Fusobacteriales bacterium]
VQALIVSNKKIKKPAYRLLFTGIVECKCGSKMHSHKINGWYNYECNKCKKIISKNKLEKEIINKLMNLKELEDLNNDNIEIEKYKSELENLNKQINKLNLERKKYIILFGKNMISEEELEKLINDIDPKVTYFKNEIKNIKSIIETKKITGKKENNLKILQDILANMEDTDREDLYKLFKLLIEKITLISRNPLKFKIYIK